MDERGDAPLLLADSHCHLDFDALAPDLDAVLARGRQVGIRRFLTIGTQVREHARVLRVAEAHDDVFASVGTHPHWADTESVDADTLVALAAHPKVVGIGEVGLDRQLTTAPFEAQLRNFGQHIAAARRTQLPLIIHSVGEDAQTGAILAREHANGAFPVVMHCFSGGRALAQLNVSLGHYLSFSGLLTYEGRDELRAIAAELPAERILIETDAPSLAPAPDIDARNEPARIVEILRLLARLRGVDERELAAQTYHNFLRAFPKLPRQ